MTFLIRVVIVVIAGFFLQVGRVLVRRRRKGITEERTGRQLSDWLYTEEQDDGFVELRYRMKCEQAELLNNILFQSDYNDLEQMREKIYKFGRSLNTKDLLGRAFFVCMATIIHNANLLDQRGN